MRAPVITTAMGLLLAALPAWYLARSTGKGDRTLLSPGPALPGHALMESACDRCHVGAGGDVQEGCLRCHGADLAAAEDTHAAARFDDPSRAGDLARLDVTRCAVCHLEHRPHLAAGAPSPAATALLGRDSVTVAADFCVVCHKEVLTERSSHAGFDVRGCAASGCHHYHDNRALYLGLLRARRGEPERLAEPRVPVRRQLVTTTSPAEVTDTALAAALAAVPAAPPAPSPSPSSSSSPSPSRSSSPPSPPPSRSSSVDAAAAEWRASAHARAGVDCAGCHRGAQTTAWVWRPDATSCARCHAPEQASFSAGKHGMRPALGLPALRVRDAHLPMKVQAPAPAPLAAAAAHGDERALGCTSCHRDHAFALAPAATDACEGCHDDGHTRAFRASPHFALQRGEAEGRLPAGAGVTCATCHLPRSEDPTAPDGVRVDHHQNRNLRPRDKMARAVCGRCHGLPFTLAALADEELVARNFRGRPRSARTGFDLVVRNAGSGTSEGGAP